LPGQFGKHLESKQPAVAGHDASASQ